MFNKYIKKELNEKISDLFQVLGICFIGCIYLTSIYYFSSYFFDFLEDYDFNILLVLNTLTFGFAISYSIKVLSNRRIKSFKRVLDTPIRNFFITFGVFYFIITFFRILTLLLDNEHFVDGISVESFLIDRLYPYLFVIFGCFMTFKYIKKKINKLLLMVGFSLIILQIIFRSLASKSVFLPNEIKETVTMDLIIWSGVYIYTGVIFFLRFNCKKISKKRKK